MLTSGNNHRKLFVKSQHMEWIMGGTAVCIEEKSAAVETAGEVAEVHIGHLHVVCPQTWSVTYASEYAEHRSGERRPKRLQRWPRRAARVTHGRTTPNPQRVSLDFAGIKLNNSTVKRT
eukprot:1948278-Pyramimonas_sp.AAC.1